MAAKKSRKQRRRRAKAYAARTVFALAVVTVVLLLAFSVTKFAKGFLGGTSEQTGSGDTIEVRKNGSVLGIIEEDFAKDYYVEEGLKAMIEEEISEYQGVSGSKNAVELKNFRVADQVAEVTIAYGSAEDYRSFNNKLLYTGQVSALMEGGISFDRTLLNADRKSEGASLEDISSVADHHAVYLEENVSLKLPGKILYHSENVSLTGKKTAVVNVDSTESAIIIYQ